MLSSLLQPAVLLKAMIETLNMNNKDSELKFKSSEF